VNSPSYLGRWLRGDGGPAHGTTGTDTLSGPGLLPPLRQPLERALAERAVKAARPVALSPGQAFAHYRIEQELGRGAMATVYRARDERDDRLLALKLLSLGDDWPEDRLAEARLRLLREAEAAARIQHPDIVNVYEAGECDGVVYLAMEFIEGVSLGTHTYQGRLLPPRMVTEMCARVADALQFAHQQGVIHRDIKPANIIFDQHRRRIRIMDFGVARLVDSHATRTGVVLGSPSYMAPEQLDGGAITGQADLFSLGVSLYQLLTGQLPFRSDSIPGLMHAIATQPHPPLRTIRPDLPAALGGVLDRALRKVPGERYESAAQMARALHDCARTIDPGLR
jgi:serine/threonine protein kinase